MRIGVDANIVKGDIETVTLSETVILKNVILNINTGSKAQLKDSDFRSETGTFLGSAQIVVPTITLPREQIYSLPTFMQTEIRKKVDELRREEAKKKGSL